VRNTRETYSGHEADASIVAQKISGMDPEKGMFTGKVK